jgi:hypothetical protein
MGDVVRRMSWSGANPAEAELLLRREWLVTNDRKNGLQVRCVSQFRHPGVGAIPERIR